MATTQFENGGDQSSKRDYAPDGGALSRQAGSFNSEDFWAARRAHQGSGTEDSLPSISITNQDGSSSGGSDSSQNSLTQELNSFIQQLSQMEQQFVQQLQGTNGSGNNGDSSNSGNGDSSSGGNGGAQTNGNDSNNGNGGQSDNNCFHTQKPPDCTQPSPGGSSEQAQPGSGDGTQQNNGGSDTTQPSNGSDTTPPSNTTDTTPPSNGSDTTPPSNTTDTTPPSNGSDTTQPSSGSDTTQPNNNGQGGTDCPTPTPTPTPSPAPTPNPTPTLDDQAKGLVAQVDNSVQQGDFQGAYNTLKSNESAFKSTDPNDYQQYTNDILNDLEHTTTSDGMTGGKVMDALSLADVNENWPGVSKADGSHRNLDPVDLQTDISVSSDPIDKALLANDSANFLKLYGEGTTNNADEANSLVVWQDSYEGTWAQSFQ